MCPAVWPGVGIATKPLGQRLGRGSLQHHLGVGLRGQLGPMDEPPAAEMPGVACRVGHVVAMRQKDVRDPPSASNRRASRGRNFGESISQLPAGCRRK